MNPAIANFEKMLAAGKDSPLLRYSLGTAYLKENDAERAAEHLREATRQDPQYSAAWKMLGKALEGAELWQEALEAYRQGIDVAQQRGDIQAAKEMGVFAKRIEKREGTK